MRKAVFIGSASFAMSAVLWRTSQTFDFMFHHALKLSRQ